MPTKNTYSGYFTLAGWFLAIILLLFIARTKIGYTLLYFFVVASIIIVLAIGSPTITNIFSTINTETVKNA